MIQRYGGAYGTLDATDDGRYVLLTDAEADKAAAVERARREGYALECLLKRIRALATSPYDSSQACRNIIETIAEAAAKSSEKEGGI